MTLARLVLDIRRRAASLDGLPRPLAIERAARELLDVASPGEEMDRTREILAALLGIEGTGTFDANALDALTPEVLVRLDMVIEELLQFGKHEEAIRALRAAVIRPVKV